MNVLQEGEFIDCRLVPRGSNYTYYAVLSCSSGQCAAIYKPQAGEAPLWDYPSGTLYKREYAAYLVSQALGWRFIPPTLVREGPYGVGAVQLFVEAEEGEHYFTFREKRQFEVQRIAAFDAVTNNGDRKAGHCLLGLDGKIWGIDHGLTFHYQQKLRTVIWDFQGQPIPEEILADLQALKKAIEQPDNGLLAELRELLAPVEVQAFVSRLEATIESGVFPIMGPGRNTPWPPI